VYECQPVLQNVKEYGMLASNVNMSYNMEV